MSEKVYAPLHPSRALAEPQSSVGLVIHRENVQTDASQLRLRRADRAASQTTLALPVAEVLPAIARSCRLAAHRDAPRGLDISRELAI